MPCSSLIVAKAIRLPALVSHDHLMRYFSAAHGTHLGNINFNHSVGIYEGGIDFS